VLPENVRVYHFAGTQHVGVQSTMPKGVCAMPPNRTDYTPLLRAALAHLDGWVKDGVPPPPSRYPRVDDGTLVPMIALPEKIPGFVLAKAPNARPRFDYGADYTRGIVGKVLPATLEGGYGVMVPKIDADGNEIAGLRLPDIAVPTATLTGWSVRSADAGGAGELCYLDGSSVPFARTKAERAAADDSRPSLAERYGTPADYAARVEAAASALAREGYLLDEDIPRIAARASAATW
jgi:hypothetical protein